MLGARAQEREASQTRLCAMLAPWSWADCCSTPCSAGGGLTRWPPLGVAALAALEGVRSWLADSLADTCCA